MHVVFFQAECGLQPGRLLWNQVRVVVVAVVIVEAPPPTPQHSGRGLPPPRQGASSAACTLSQRVLL